MRYFEFFNYNFLKRWMIGKTLYSALKSIGKTEYFAYNAIGKT